MKKILLHYIENVFKEDVRDYCTQPFIFLKERLKSYGYELELTAKQSLGDVAFVFFINFENVYPYHGLRGKVRWLNDVLKDNKKRDLYSELNKANQAEKAVLFLWEGPTVSYNSYNEYFLKKFKHVFSWNDDLIAKYKFNKFYLPISDSIGEFKTLNFNERQLLTAISWNKKSKAVDEMYEFRKTEMKLLSMYLTSDFKFYGRDWDKVEGDDRVLLENYGGPVNNKIDVLPKYKFCLCYENTFGLPGYVTEKIFDIMRCGVVPIYKGASNILDYIPKECFIDRNDFRNVEDLAKYLRSIDESEFSDYLKNIINYLDSDNIKYFLPEYFSTNIINKIKKIEGQKPGQ